LNHSSINELADIQYDTDNSSRKSGNSSNVDDLINRLNSRSILESYYVMGANLDGVELEDPDPNVFSHSRMMKNRKHLAPLIFPAVGFKKAKVSMETLALMKQRMAAGSKGAKAESKWVPNGHQKQSKVFHKVAGEGTPAKMTLAQKRKAIYS
jgi:hypothetical protein